MIFMLIFVLDFEEFSAPATNGSARYKRFRRKGVIKLPLADFRHFGAKKFMYLIGMNCQVKCNSRRDLVQTNLAEYGNAKLSWAWR